jgi:hypothetical protein
MHTGIFFKNQKKKNLTSYKEIFLEKWIPRFVSQKWVFPREIVASMRIGICCSMCLSRGRRARSRRVVAGGTERVGTRFGLRVGFGRRALHRQQRYRMSLSCHLPLLHRDKQPKAAEARSGIERREAAPVAVRLALLRPQATGSARRRLCRFFSGSRVCQPAACHATRTRAGRRRKDHRARERRSARRIFGGRASCRSAFCCPPLRRPSLPLWGLHIAVPAPGGHVFT